jgi:hypothetical protein
MVFIFCPVSALACISEFKNYAKAAELLTGTHTSDRMGVEVWGLSCQHHKTNLSFRILKLAQVRM